MPRQTRSSFRTATLTTSLTSRKLPINAAPRSLPFMRLPNVGMNIGGSVELPWGWVKMTQAIHSSQLPDGSYAGVAAGFLLELGDKKIYFACDTALFSDMKMIGEKEIDVAILPIGDLFTMGPKDSVAATNLIDPKQVLPSHYNTWPPIEQDAQAWAAMVKAGSTATPIVLEPGQSHLVE
ncbi:UNVERIFIED_CONTAM: hypothetical protein GTU68_050111 [Idotea baltica]|nr:hypothetical protein [Idotea baltica]